MTVKDIMGCITAIAPLSWQEDYDNAGLQVGDLGAEVHKALIALDVTEAVVNEALAKQCDLIVSHHPLIFKGLKHVTSRSFIERIVRKAIKQDLNIISMHTNLDNSYWGVSRVLAERLGLSHLEILDPMSGKLFKLVVFVPLEAADQVRQVMFAAGAGCIGNYDSCSFNVDGAGSFKAGEQCHPYVGEIGELHFERETRVETVVPEHLLSDVIKAMKAVHPYEEVAYDVYPLQNDYPFAGAGMKGRYEVALSETEFLQRAAEALGSPCLRHSALTGRKVTEVAVCGGSGAFLLSCAKRNHVDVFLTADIKYHDFFEPDGDLLMVDAGHFETEQFSKVLIKDLIQKKFPNFAAEIAETNTNSVHYFCKKQN